MAGLTETVACFATNTPSTDIPAEAVEKAKKAIADTVGVILAGTGSELAPALLRYVARAGGGGSSPILATGLRTSQEVAAMANGTLGHALDFDDVLPLAQGHVSAVVLPALFAGLDGRLVDGRALIEAYIVGIEVTARIGAGIGEAHYERGWHPTATAGIFGAVAGLARLRHLEVPTARQAIGIASSMASGLRRNFGTMTKPVHCGWAARSALAACRLASSGFTAAPDALEAKSGFFATFGDEQANPERCAEQLGRPYVVADPGSSLKRYACCYEAHRALDAILHLQQQHGLTADNVESVLCTVPPGCLMPLIYSRPETGLQGKFSMEYALAAAVLDGGISLWTFTDEAVQRPEIRALYPRVKSIEDPRVSPGDPLGESGTIATRGFVEVQVVMKGGVSFTARVDSPRGSPGQELTWDEVREKFLDCATHGRVDRSRAERALEILFNLERSPDVGDLLELLR